MNEQSAIWRCVAMGRPATRENVAQVRRMFGGVPFNVNCRCSPVSPRPEEATDPKERWLEKAVMFMAHYGSGPAKIKDYLEKNGVNI